MFKRKQHVILALDEETLMQLNEVDENMTIIVELLTEAVGSLKQVRAVINGSLSEAVPIAEDVVGVEVLADEEEEPLPMPKDGLKAESPYVAGKGVESMSDESDPDRIRGNPFARTPRVTQVEWILRWMADGEWYSAQSIAIAIADEARSLRYIGHAIQGRMRELHEEGKLQRRPSQAHDRSMYEYRIRQEN